MNKTQEKLLKRIATSFRDESLKDHRIMNVYGEDLIRQGHTEYGGKPVDEKETYTVAIDAGNKVNHFKRLKDSYKQYGAQGIIDYGKKYLKPETHGEWEVIIKDIFTIKNK